VKCPHTGRRFGQSRPTRRQVAARDDLVPGDPLAHRALESLLRAESSVSAACRSDLEREASRRPGFSVLVVLATAGGELELRTLRKRLRTSKANATEVVTTARVPRLRHARAPAHRSPRRQRHADARAREVVDASSPRHRAVRTAFAVLDEDEEAASRGDLPQAGRALKRSRRPWPRRDERGRPQGLSLSSHWPGTAIDASASAVDGSPAASMIAWVL